MNDRKIFRPCLLFVFLLALAVTGLCQQQSQPEKSKQTPTEDDVVHLSTTLVQVDAVVTDKKGHHIDSLKAEDFQLLEDGRPQKITHFSYVVGQPGSATNPLLAGNNGETQPPSTVAGQPGQAPRMIALVVDDMGLSFENLAYVRSSLEKFVDSTMLPTDSIAIIRTSSGMGALQQFTSDKRLLHAAIDRIQWKGFSHSSGLFAPDIVDPRAPDMGNGLKDADPEKFRENLFAVGTLGALNYVIRGLREYPGRKSVLLISQNLPIFKGNDKVDRIADALERLIDLANRASVVVYTMDARGLSSTMLSASESIPPGKEMNPGELLTSRNNDYIQSQGGLSYLAQQTGGIFIHDTNDLRAGMGRVIEEQNGFYLLGYQPDDSTFQRPGDVAGKPKKPLPYHKLTVRVKQSDLLVRSRAGFFAMTNDEARETRATAKEQIDAVLFSPFVAKDVHLRLTSLFATDSKSGPIVRSLLLIDAKDLSFKEEPESGKPGSVSAEIDLVAMTYDENGNIIDRVPRTDTLRLQSTQVLEKARANGIVYTFDVPIKKPGAFQLRLIVRDNASERLGSASQYIDVPDLKKDRLALSGIAISGYQPQSAEKAAASNQPMDDPDSHASPAVRQFRPSMTLNYIFEIYNARLDKTTKLPNLQMQSRLFRDGKEVYASAATPVSVKSIADLSSIVAGMTMQLAKDQQPGQYALEVTVTDLAAVNHRAATQWIDFEVIKR